MFIKILFRSKILFYNLVLVLILSGCGGNSSSSKNLAPSISSSNTVSVVENQTAVLTVMALDPENDNITFSISGGADQGEFSIDLNSGVLTFNSAPDFENPTDSDTNNTYIVEVTARDDGNSKGSDSQTITITVTDVSEVESISHNGFTYNIITSPITGKKWLDRNLGAYKVCTKSRDDTTTPYADDAAYVTDQKDCFGDYYQWGRNADGHQEAIDDTVNTPNKTKSNTTAAFANTDGEISNVGHGDFITSNSGNTWDWVLNTLDNDGAKRIANWNKSDGSGICPNGFRVPTRDEIEEETIDFTGTEDENTGAIKVINRHTAFKNFLKLPVGGARSYNDGLFYEQGSRSYLWSNQTGGNNSRRLSFDSISAFFGNAFRSQGHFIRCVKN